MKQLKRLGFRPLCVVLCLYENVCNALNNVTFAAVGEFYDYAVSL